MVSREERLVKEIERLLKANWELISQLEGVLDPSEFSLIKKLYSGYEKENPLEDAFEDDEGQILAQSLSHRQLIDTRSNYDSLLKSANPQVFKYLKSDEQRAKKRAKTVLSRLQDAKITDSVLRENVSRFFGISAFPISCDNEDLYLGLRLELFNQRSGEFEKPHYIILKRSQEKGLFELFQYTVPVYIGITDIKFTDSTILDFAKEVYNRLTACLQKQIIFDQIGELDNVKILDSDLSHNRVTLQLSEAKIVLWMDYISVTKAQVVNSHAAGLGHEKMQLLESVMKGRVEGLEERVKNALTEMSKDYS